MRKLYFILICLMVWSLNSFAKEADTLTDNNVVVYADTIFRTDTIHVKEVITRTDVIHRTEKVIRYESKKPFDVEVSVDSQSPIVNSEPQISTTSSDEKIIISDKPEATGIVVSDSSASVEVIPSKEESEYNSVNAEYAGNVTRIPKGNEIDLNEKVIFRGDTINMILKDRNLGRYDRGLFNYLFIPKGIWQIGLTASYGEFSTENLEILDLISDIDFGGKLWSIRPYFSYFLKSNISLGLRLGYTHGKASIGAFNVDIDEDMSFNLHDIMYKSNNYSAAVTFAQYLGIARKGRFGVFNEVELALSGGNSDFNRPYNGEIRQTHTTTFQAALNFSPGVCVYVLDQVSFNVSLGVFGLNIKHEKQKVNGEELGWRTTSGANFRFNIFNINFGIAVNI